MMLGHELESAEKAVAAAETSSGPVHYPVFQAMARRGTIKPFDLEVRKGEVVGIAGLLGSGRTETAELLFGVHKADSGSAEIGGKPVNLAVEPACRDRRTVSDSVPEDRKIDGIIGELSVRENIALALAGAARLGTSIVVQPTRTPLRTATSRRSTFAPATARSRSGFCPGGNQQKAILARWLATNPEFPDSRRADARHRCRRPRRNHPADRASSAVKGHVADRDFVGARKSSSAYSSRVVVLQGSRAHVAELDRQRNRLTASHIVDAIAAAAQAREAMHELRAATRLSHAAARRS